MLHSFKSNHAKGKQRQGNNSDKQYRTFSNHDKICLSKTIKRQETFLEGHH